MGNESIQVRGARVHNLKNINSEIPPNALLVKKDTVDEVAERVLALAPGSRYYLLFPVRGTAAARGPCPPFPPATWPTCPAGRRRSACARRPTCGASLSV
jgi:hypothetical protein